MSLHTMMHGAPEIHRLRIKPPVDELLIATRSSVWRLMMDVYASDKSKRMYRPGVTAGFPSDI